MRGAVAQASAGDLATGLLGEVVRRSSPGCSVGVGLVFRLFDGERHAGRAFGGVFLVHVGDECVAE